MEVQACTNVGCTCPAVHFPDPTPCCPAPQIAYSITLQSPRLPCINVSKDLSKVVWLPMEMCE